MVYLLKMVDLSMANCECHNQMVYLVDVERMPPFLSTWEGDQHGACDSCVREKSPICTLNKII